MTLTLRKVFPISHISFDLSIANYHQFYLNQTKCQHTNPKLGPLLHSFIFLRLTNEKTLCLTEKNKLN